LTGNRRRAERGRPCSGEEVTAARSEGRGETQELTAVRTHHVSRTIVVRRADPDENPRWRWRVTVDDEVSVTDVGGGVAQ
jgi:hypothetical protein